MGPTTGPRSTFTPLVRYSPPMPKPRCRVRFLFQLAPTWIPLGQVLTKSVPRSPFPASPMHMPGKPRRLTAGTKPGQLVLLGTPAVMSICVSCQSRIHPTSHILGYTPSPSTSCWRLVPLPWQMHLPMNPSRSCLLRKTHVSIDLEGHILVRPRPLGF